MVSLHVRVEIEKFAGSALKSRSLLEAGYTVYLEAVCRSSTPLVADHQTSMTAPPLLAILLVTSSDLTSPNRHLLFHYPPHPSLSSVADEEEPDDSSSDAESVSSSSSTSSTTSIPSSKYSRITGENNRYTIDEDEDHHENLDMEEDVDRTPWRRTVLTEWEQTIFGLTKRDLGDILIPK